MCTNEVTIMGTGNSALRNYEIRDQGDLWVINRAFLIEQDPDMLFLFHPVEDVFPESRDILKVKNARCVIMSNQNEDLVQTVNFPMRQIIQTYGISYFKCTVAYCLAYACMKGYRKINLVGIDYDGAEREEEKSCVEFWVGFLKGMGCEVTISEGSYLCKDAFYGYETDYNYEEEEISSLRT